MSDHTPPDDLPQLVDDLERKVLGADKAIPDEDLKQPAPPDNAPAVPGTPEPPD